MALAIGSLLAKPIGKFLMKNSGKLIGGGVNLAIKHFDKDNKKGWRDKANNVLNSVTNFSNDILGEDNIITKQLQNASNAVSGKDVKWNPIDDKQDTIKNESMLALPSTTGYYNRNLGGTNFKRRIKRKRLKRKLRG
jgi:hypothetical protein